MQAVAEKQMGEIDIRQDGRAGRITLTRPKALNALTDTMVDKIEAALTRWRDDPAVDLVLVDAEGDRAFCAGGDIAELYARGTRGDHHFGQDFWRREYRLNLTIAEYAKPIVTFLQGFAMGGGVGVGCHGSHRVVCESSRVAMPECGIGLVPDVGGSKILADAPGRSGEYLGMTGARMGPDDAIYAGFADSYAPWDRWEALKAALAETGDVGVIADFTETPPEGDLLGGCDVLVPQEDDEMVVERTLDPSDRLVGQRLSKIHPVDQSADGRREGLDLDRRHGAAPRPCMWVSVIRASNG